MVRNLMVLLLVSWGANIIMYTTCKCSLPYHRLIIDIYREFFDKFSLFLDRTYSIFYFDTEQSFFGPVLLFLFVIISRHTPYIPLDTGVSRVLSTPPPGMSGGVQIRH